MLIASSGTKLPVISREAKLDSEIVDAGAYYEANYDITRELSRFEALELVMAMRRKSLDYRDMVLFQYAGIEGSSPQTLTVQFKALKSTSSPDPITIGLILIWVVAGCLAAGAVVATYIVLKSMDKVATGLVAPFAPTVTTTYIDPETGDRYATREEYEYAWTQRHPGTTPPPPGEDEKTRPAWEGIIYGLAVIIAAAFVVMYFWKRGGFKAPKLPGRGLKEKVGR